MQPSSGFESAKAGKDFCFCVGADRDFPGYKKSGSYHVYAIPVALIFQLHAGKLWNRNARE